MRRACRVLVLRPGDERLNFNEHGARALHARRHDRACDSDGALLQEHLRRVRDGHKPRARHLEDAKLVRRAEAVFRRAHDAVVVMPLALEVEHRVNDVFERLRACDRAFLRHVADEEHRYRVVLREHKELPRDLSHLRDRAGR